MNPSEYSRIQKLVFALVGAAVTNIYVTQPVLPILRIEFNTTIPLASLSVSAVILGIALANLPFGSLSDRVPVRRLILIGGVIVAALGFLCAFISDLWLFLACRFLQGIFIPALTTCVAAYLASNLPLRRLNVVMGSYVSATVAGGLGGRLLGGWIHPPLHWRYAFVTTSFLLLLAVMAAVAWLPEGRRIHNVTESEVSFGGLLARSDILRVLMVPFGSSFAFGSAFNYLPFYLSQAPFHASTELITLLYLVYLVGIFIGPVAGKISNRIGNGGTIVFGTCVFAIALTATLIKSLPVVLGALAALCAGFFGVHAAGVGLLNQKLSGGHGKANSLYLLLYYIGVSLGITICGYVYTVAGWYGVIGLDILLLLLPLSSGISESYLMKRST